MDKIKIAVGYIRCSTDMQGDSPDQQKNEIAEFAELEGYRIVEWFDDFGKSGTTFDERPAFQRLRTIVDNNPIFNAVICYDESRWGRAIDAEENTYWRVYFRKRGVEVILVKTAVDKKNEFAPMLSAFEGVQASQYSKKLSELTLRGTKNNRLFSNGGTAPYGYKRIAVNIKTQVERELINGSWCVSRQEKVKWGLGDQKEIDVVRYIFQQRGNGTSCIVIAKNLNEMNVACPKRGRWKNSDQKWSSSSIDAIVDNPVYYGARVYNRNSMSKIQAQQQGKERKNGVRYPHWRNNPNEWIIEENAHPGIISKEEWQQANIFRRSRSSQSKPRHYVPYLLTGLMKCRRCGFHYQGQSTKTSHKNYYRYVCGGYNGKRVCSYCAVDRDKLENFAIRSVKKTLHEPSIIGKIEERLQMLVNMQPKFKENECVKLDKSIQEVEKKIKNLTSAIEEGAELKSIVERLKELEKEHKVLLKKKSGLDENEKGEVNVKNITEEVKDFINEFEKTYVDAPQNEKKDLIKRCISNIEIDPDKRKAKVIVRCVPAVNPQLEKVYDDMDKNEKVTKIRPPFRKVDVAGVGLEPTRNVR